MNSPSPCARPLRVLLLEDREEILRGVSIALNRDARCSVVATCSSLEDGFAALRRGVACDVALIDLGLPDGSGLSFIAALKEALPTCDVVVWTQFDDDQHVFEALQLGATGYLLKMTPPQVLVSALVETAQGGAPMSPAIARRVLASFGRTRSLEPKLDDLSERERTVLQLLARGHTYAEIAAQLTISLTTVQTFVKRIYSKLGVHSKAEATRIATRSGIV